MIEGVWVYSCEIYLAINIFFVGGEVIVCGRGIDGQFGVYSGGA
jgi:hypothetical protein